jgi:hypothetical protein
VRARDSNRDVDLAVGRPIVPAHTGRGYRVPRYVVSSVPTCVRGRHLTGIRLRPHGLKSANRAPDAARAPHFLPVARPCAPPSTVTSSPPPVHDISACGPRATIGKVQFRYNRGACGGLTAMAREGIEPPTRGFSVASRKAPGNPLAPLDPLTVPARRGAGRRVSPKIPPKLSQYRPKKRLSSVVLRQAGGLAWDGEC